MRKKTQEQFLEQVKDRGYDYSKTVYVNAKTKIIIICKEHREFEQTPDNHLQGKECPKCSGKFKKTQEQFLEQVKDRGYDYSKTVYVNDRTKVIITCKKHGDFEQTPNHHLYGNGCPKCVDNRKTQEEFLEEVKDRGYDYSKTVYVNSYTKIIIICKKHGAFEQKPNSHLQGQGCPKCSGTQTALILENWLNNNNIKFTTQKPVKSINGNTAFFDFHLYELDIILELDGRQHFKTINYFKTSSLSNLQQDIFKQTKTSLSVIRILQEDILKGNFDFHTLSKAIKTLSTSKKQIVYLPDSSTYKNHQFPWKVYSKKEILDEFKNLQQLKSTGRSCSNYFFQYERLSTPNYNGNSAVDYFYNERDDILKRAKNKDLLQTITWLNHSPAQFSPYAAILVYKYFNAKSIFDPYAGWGDRCLAALACNIDYLGIDCNPNLVEPFKNLIDTFDHTSDVKFICDRGENILYTADLVFSSPPFYKKNGRLVEQYNNTEIDYQTFLNTSLFPIMKTYIKTCPICFYIPENMYIDLTHFFGKANLVISIDTKRKLYCWIYH